MNCDRRRAVNILAFLLTAYLVHRAPAQQPTQLAEVLVRSVELAEIGPDSATATVRVSATAGASATLRGLFFDQVTFNGVRIRVPPVPGPIRLRAGESIVGLPDLRAVLTYRELDSLDPLRRVIRDGRAQVHAEIRAQVELTLFQKLALLTGGAWATVPVDQQVTVDVPGGAIGRIAALGTLLAAEPLWIAGRSANEWRQNRTALAERVRSTLTETLVSFETQYKLKARGGETASMETYRLGFLTGGGQVIAPAEVVEPWSFDNTLAEALDKGDISLDETSTEIVAVPLAGSRTYSLQRRELRILQTLRATEKAISPTTKRRYHVRFRNSNANAVLFEIPELKSAGPAGPGIVLAGESASGDWQPAVVVRRVGPDIPPALWVTEARVSDGRYQIQDPVDSSAFGSPVWVHGGVAALLQDESSAVVLGTLLKKLK